MISWHEAVSLRMLPFGPDLVQIAHSTRSTVKGRILLGSGGFQFIYAKLKTNTTSIKNLTPYINKNRPTTFLKVKKEEMFLKLNNWMPLHKKSAANIVLIKRTKKNPIGLSIISVRELVSISHTMLLLSK